MSLLETSVIIIRVFLFYDFCMVENVCTNYKTKSLVHFEEYEFFIIIKNIYVIISVMNKKDIFLPPTNKNIVTWREGVMLELQALILKQSYFRRL